MNCGQLISGVTGNLTMETNKRLWDLARSPELLPRSALFSGK
jgi:hypothetical protein